MMKKIITLLTVILGVAAFGNTAEARTPSQEEVEEIIVDYGGYDLGKLSEGTYIVRYSKEEVKFGKSNAGFLEDEVSFPAGTKYEGKSDKYGFIFKHEDNVYAYMEGEIIHLADNVKDVLDCSYPYFPENYNDSFYSSYSEEMKDTQYNLLFIMNDYSCKVYYNEELYDDLYYQPEPNAGSENYKHPNIVNTTWYYHLVYDKETGQIQQIDYLDKKAPLIIQECVLTDVEYIGFSYPNGDIFLSNSKNIAYIVSNVGVEEINGVDKVVLLNYNWRADAPSQPLFLMQDGAYVVYDPGNASYASYESWLIDIKKKENYYTPIKFRKNESVSDNN